MLPFLRLSLPLSILLLPWLLLPLLASLDPAISALGQRLPALLSIIAFLLACAFKRGRIMLAALLTALTDYTLQQLLFAGIEQPAIHLLLALLAVVLPLQLGWILIQRDTSPLSVPGMLRAAICAVPFLVLFLLWHLPNLSAESLPHLPAVVRNPLSVSSTLSAAALWITLPILALSLLLALVRRTPDEVALFGVILLQLLALGALQDAFFSFLAQGSAALLLIVALVQHIYGLAFIDTLTGVPGRRALEHKLATLGRHYTIAMLDIDHFKRFNDTYGHDVGDEVLRMVASQLRKVQAGGKLYRYGGEEFTLVFNHRHENDTLEPLNQIRQQIEQYPMRVRAPDRPVRQRDGRPSRGQKADSRHERVKVTLSIGVAERQADEQPDAVIKRADQALYRAKEAGRNRVIAASSPTRRRVRSV